MTQKRKPELSKKTLGRWPRSMPLWPVRNQCGDPFGPGVLDEISAVEGIQLLCEAKQSGLIDYWSAHDCDIVPWDPNDPEDYLNDQHPIHDQLTLRKQLLDAAGLKKMNVITCNLHTPLLFANGGLTNPDPAVRLMAAKKVLRSLWIGNYFSARTVVYWTARDGFEVASAVPFRGVNPKQPDEGPYQWLMQGLNLVSYTCRNQGYSMTGGSIEPKNNEPRGVVFLPLVGSALALIYQLNDPEWWGLNPEVPQHSLMGCQDPLLEVVQAVEHGKLPLLHVGGQISCQFDNDFPPLFGPDAFKRMVQIFVYLAEVGWDGVLEYDCHVLRSDCAPGKLNMLSIRRKFIKTCVEMTCLLENILVPRVINSTRFQKARQAIWQPKGLSSQTAQSYTNMLSDLSPAFGPTNIRNAKVDVGAALSRTACCGEVDRTFNLAFTGAEEELAQAMEKYCGR